MGAERRGRRAPLDIAGRCRDTSHLRSRPQLCAASRLTVTTLRRKRVTIYLIRHAKAGDRDTWLDDDRLRPLSGRGHRQARLLVDLLQRRDVRSRAVEPVRALHGDRRADRRRARSLRSSRSRRSPRARASTRRSRSCASTRRPGALMCTHGDVMPMLLDHYASAGVDIPSDRAVAEGLHVDARHRQHRRGRARALPPRPAA